MIDKRFKITDDYNEIIKCAIPNISYYCTRQRTLAGVGYSIYS